MKPEKKDPREGVALSAVQRSAEFILPNAGKTIVTGLFSLSLAMGLATGLSFAQVVPDFETVRQQQMLKEMELKQAESLKDKELKEARSLKEEEFRRTAALKAEELEQSFLLGGFDLLLKLVGGLFVALAAWTGWRTFQVSQQGQITDRFTKAMENLGQEGDQSVTTRIGGVHALERIAKDSAYDHWAVMEVLTGWIRQRYTWVADGHHAPERPPVDIQAALTALGRREYQRESADQRLDLHQTDLRGFNLQRVHMQRVDFTAAHLESTNLRIC